MLTHLEQLEAESIHIMREVVAECENPVMLYSIGKDSAVMLHLAMKAFHPARPPFPPIAWLPVKVVLSTVIVLAPFRIAPPMPPPMS